MVFLALYFANSSRRPTFYARVGTKSAAGVCQISYHGTFLRALMKRVRALVVRITTTAMTSLAPVA